jgi:hypothetical protein
LIIDTSFRIDPGVNEGERSVDFKKGGLLEERDMVLIVDLDGAAAQRLRRETVRAALKTG